MGRKKNIENPAKLWEYFLGYKEAIKRNPIIVEDYVGKDADLVHRKKERPLTIEGFENYLEDLEIICHLSDYFANTDSRYSDFTTICTRIKRNVRQDQIEGGMVNIYNPSITQRLNGLVDKKETDLKGSLSESLKVEIVNPEDESD